MSRMIDPHTALGSALSRLSGGHLVESEATRWSSATFSGSRHRYIFALRSPSEKCVLDGISGREFILPGHLVADVALTARTIEGDQRRFTIEALTIEDR